MVKGKAQRSQLFDLNIWRWPLALALALFMFVVLGLPLIALSMTAITQNQGDWQWSQVGFHHFRKVFFSMDETHRALSHSLFLGASVATASVVFSLMLSFLQWKTGLKGRRFLEIGASFPYALPGTVIALALILCFSQSFFGLAFSLYNSLALIGLAYFLKFQSLAVKNLGEGFCQIDNSLGEAARVSGASGWVSIKTIWLPLMKPSLMASWFLIFLPCLSELTMTIFLTGPGIETIGTLIFQLQDQIYH